ncbi:hypothetical protein [Paraburkholderia sp. MM6662-R1]|uniref:hypothetical protein n=1 Tax=Paraburkholderia sp. MM6662-R1 TaxID=2991066 RepID=UPI003D1C17F3
MPDVNGAVVQVVLDALYTSTVDLLLPEKEGVLGVVFGVYDVNVAIANLVQSPSALTVNTVIMVNTEMVLGILGAGITMGISAPLWGSVGIGIGMGLAAHYAAAALTAALTGASMGSDVSDSGNSDAAGSGLGPP